MRTKRVGSSATRPIRIELPAEPGLEPSRRRGASRSGNAPTGQGPGGPGSVLANPGLGEDGSGSSRACSPARRARPAEVDRGPGADAVQTSPSSACDQTIRVRSSGTSSTPSASTVADTRPKDAETQREASPPASPSRTSADIARLSPRGQPAASRSAAPRIPTRGATARRLRAARPTTKHAGRSASVARLARTSGGETGGRGRARRPGGSAARSSAARSSRQRARTDPARPQVAVPAPADRGENGCGRVDDRDRRGHAPALAAPEDLREARLPRRSRVEHEPADGADDVELRDADPAR
jgi:hypothetical protein